MNKCKNLKKIDWYEILNQRYQFVDKEIENVTIKSKKFFDKQLKLNRVSLFFANSEIKPKKVIRNLTDSFFPFSDENQLISNRLNIKNYKNKKFASYNDYICMKDILQRLNNKRFSMLRLKKNSRNNLNNLYQRTFFNSNYKCNKTNSQDKKIKQKSLLNETDNNKMSFPIKKQSTMINIFNKTRNYSYNNLYYYPEIKAQNNINKNNSSNKNNNNISKSNLKPKSKSKIKSKSFIKNQKKLMKFVLNEGGKTLYRGNSITGDILRFRRDLNERMNSSKDILNNQKNINNRKAKIYEKDNDYIVINKTKVHQTDPESETKKKLMENIENIKNINDIEEKLLSDEKNIFDLMKRNLIKNYINKTKKHLMYNLIEEENL